MPAAVGEKVRVMWKFRGEDVAAGREGDVEGVLEDIPPTTGVGVVSVWGMFSDIWVWEVSDCGAVVPSEVGVADASDCGAVVTLEIWLAEVSDCNVVTSEVGAAEGSDCGNLLVDDGCLVAWAIKG